MSQRQLLKPLILLMIVFVMAGATACTAKEEGETISKTIESYVPVEIETIKAKSIANSIDFTGKVFATEEVTVVPKIPGIVESVHIKLGDEIKKDAPLFSIEQEDLLKAVEQAENGVALAKKGIEQAETALQTASVNYEMTKEKIDNAKLNYERTKKLFEEGAVSKSQLEQAELGASEKPLEVSKVQMDQAEIARDQAENQLRQAEIAYEQALHNLSSTIIKSPLSGVISDLNIKEGQLASSAQPAAIIVDLNEVYLQLNVPENVIGYLSLGQEITVKIPSALDEPIKGKVDYISSTIDPKTQLYLIKVYLNNKDLKIRPGMNGEGIVDIETRENTIVVKNNAVLNKDDKFVVFVTEGDKAIEKEVTLGLENGDDVEILSGLEVGEKIIVKGQHYVEDGQIIKVVRGE